MLAALPLSAKVIGGQIEISWQNNAAGDAEREADVAQILLAAEDENLTAFVENAAARSDGSYTANIPVGFQGKSLHIWLAFRSADGEQVSNSQYLGSFS